MKIFNFYMIFINLIGFIFCFIDKYLARHNGYRMPERLLFVVSFLGGCFGFYLGMLGFHHKTRKFRFKILIPSFIIMWVMICIILEKCYNIFCVLEEIV